MHVNAKRILAWIPPAAVVLAIVSAYTLGVLCESLGMLNPDASPAAHALAEVLEVILSSTMWVIYLMGIVLVFRESRRLRAMRGQAVPEGRMPEGLRGTFYPDVYPFALLHGKWGKRYLDRERTPLRWHIWVCFVILPLAFLQSILGITIWFSNMTSTSLAFGSSTAMFNALIAAIALGAMSEFASWEKSGVYLYLAILGLQIAQSLIQTLSSGSAALFGRVFGFAVGLIPVIIYYKKRWLLFASSPCYDPIPHGDEAPPPQSTAP